MDSNNKKIKSVAHLGSEITWSDLSPFFSVHELFSPETRNFPHLIDPVALSLLNAFRRSLGIPLLVNHGPHSRRGVRSAREQIALQNETGNAADLSMHVTGKAFDISSPKISVSELAEKAIAFEWPCVGIYPSFVHVDFRFQFRGNPQVIFRR